MGPLLDEEDSGTSELSLSLSLSGETLFTFEGLDVSQGVCCPVWHQDPPTWTLTASDTRSPQPGDAPSIHRATTPPRASRRRTRSATVASSDVPREWGMCQSVGIGTNSGVTSTVTSVSSRPRPSAKSAATDLGGKGGLQRHFTSSVEG